MKGILSQFWSAIQVSLFPFLEEELGPLTKKQTTLREKKKRDRPKKGEIKEKPIPTRVQKQSLMKLDQMLDELPKACDIGVKKK